jgi:hypothetical protein
MRDGIVRNPWLEAEDKLLLALDGERLSWEAIAQRFVRRHSLHSCKGRMVLLRRRTGLNARKQQRPWSTEERAELLRRGDVGDPFEVIGRDIARTRWACKVQYHCLKRANSAPPVTMRTVREAATIKAAEVKRETAALPRQSLTAAVLGDPLPGRSALDRKRAGIEDDPPRVDYRFTDLRPKPTLAGMA